MKTTPLIGTNIHGLIRIILIYPNIEDAPLMMCTYRLSLQNEEAYKNIIKASKGSTGEKKLAPGFITKFLRHFPSLHNEAIDAMVDLIEDEDVQVSRSVCGHMTVM